MTDPSLTDAELTALEQAVKRIVAETKFVQDMFGNSLYVLKDNFWWPASAHQDVLVALYDGLQPDVLLRLLADYRAQAQTIAFQKEEINHLIENLHDSQGLSRRSEEPR